MTTHKKIKFLGLTDLPCAKNDLLGSTDSDMQMSKHLFLDM